MNYYDKEKNILKDEQIRDNFIKISKGKYVNSSEYFFIQILKLKILWLLIF